MSETTAKIEEIITVREYDGQNGKVWYYKLAMDNGEVGEIGKKKPDAFKVGDSLTYTVEAGQYGNKFKAVQNGNGFQGRGGGSRGGNESFALSYSKDYHVALIASGKTGEATAEQITASILKTADKFKAWLDANK